MSGRGWVVGLAWTGLTASAFGQNASAGPHFDSGRLRFGTDTFAAYVINGTDTSLNGYVITSLETNGARLTRTYSEVGQIISTEDTIVDRRDDFRPLAHSTHSPYYVAWIAFDSAAVTGWQRLPNGDSVVVRVALPFPMYNAASFDLIVRASPLQDRFEVSLPGFRTGPNSIVTMRGRVTGAEAVDGHDCWVFKGDNANTPVTFWIDKQSAALRRQLIQFRVDMFHLLTAVPPTLVFITPAEQAGLVIGPTSLRHPNFGFSAPLPHGLTSDTALQRQSLRGIAGHPNLYAWVLADSARASIIIIEVYKGFPGTLRALQRFALELSSGFKTNPSWEMLVDSTYWEEGRREALLTAHARNGNYVSSRCVPSPENRRPLLLVCMQTVSPDQHAFDRVRTGLVVAGPPSQKP